MKQYTDGKRIIEATEKMHGLVYKSQGFITFDEFNEKLRDMSLNQLKGLAKERRLDGYSGLDKEELIELLLFKVTTKENDEKIEESAENMLEDEKTEEVDTLKVGV